MIKITNLFPGGKQKVFTLSYDDGVTQDRRLVEIFNKYGLKGTFNLNSGIQSEDSWWNGKDTIIKRINKADILGLYDGHEVAIHSLTHPHLEDIPKELIVEEVLQDKKNLEEMFGYPVRGMAYPFGTYNNTVIEVLKALGVEYSRTVMQHENFNLPEDFLKWHPTAHHKNPKLMDIAKHFLSYSPGALSLFYVWGHSYEFDEDRNWEMMEEFCELISNKEDIWYATNIEIVDYLNALKNLKFSSEFSVVYNPSAISVWVNVNEVPVEIKAGEIKKINL